MVALAATPDPDLADRLVDVLRRRPAGLFLDVDGTLSPIVPLPEQARLLPGVRPALRRLRDRLDLLAVVSGRSVLNARRMVRVARVAYVGNHGLEAWLGSGSGLLPEVRPWVPRVRTALAEVGWLLAEPGIILEDKGATAAIHYRLSPTPAAARRSILEALAQSPTAADLRIEEGRMVVNLLPPVPASKGTAVRSLVGLRGLRGVAYFGDDVTDLHALEALAELRLAGAVTTLGVAVAAADVPGPVSAAADTTVRSPHDVAALLTHLADNL